MRTTLSLSMCVVWNTLTGVLAPKILLPKHAKANSVWLQSSWKGRWKNGTKKERDVPAKHDNSEVIVACSDMQWGMQA